MNTKNPAINGKSELLSIRYPLELVARMRKRAQAEGIPVSRLAIKAVAQYLDTAPDIEPEEEEEEEEWGERPFEVRQRGLYREGGRGI